MGTLYFTAFLLQPSTVTFNLFISAQLYGGYTVTYSLVIAAQLYGVFTITFCLLIAAQLYGTVHCNLLPILISAQLYMIAKKSRQESKGADSGSGVEILVGNI